MAVEKLTEVKEIIFSEDPYGMNWLREDFPYAKAKAPAGLSCQVSHAREGDCIHTEALFTNNSKKPVFTHAGSISLSFPLEDRYDSSQICMRYRCHTHIFCGENVSYILALRMGGEAPHLGMALTEGSLSSYSIQRNTDKESNDRGCFWLHPSAMQLAPGETKRLCWIVFPHKGREDFYRQLGHFNWHVQVESDRYVLFPGETAHIRITPSFEAKRISINGREVLQKNGQYLAEYPASKPGEQTLRICANGIRTTCRLLVQEAPGKLAAARCRFLARRQQYHGNIQELEGAYLAYDNEEDLPVYRPANDYNGGRERIGMGLLMSAYLQGYGNGDKDEAELEKSLQEYVQFVIRELADTKSGQVFNDIGRDNSYARLYNPPWYATFFTELYRQYRRKEYLETAYRILLCFYKEGGDTFYPICLPILMIDQALGEAAMEAERADLRQWFQKHADWLAKTGRDYPASEVNYEQAIVAPAADILLQAYLLTKEAPYLQAAEKQLQLLALFHGTQPDYRLYGTAIRHWDGFWFGKRALYGDTFPHYWSALTGNVFHLYAKATGDMSYEKRAEDCLRGVLPLIFPDGRASCAYLFPHSVNGTLGAYYDPYANDQDWGLYFYLRHKGLSMAKPMRNNVPPSSATMQKLHSSPYKS